MYGLLDGVIEDVHPKRDKDGILRTTVRLRLLDAPINLLREMAALEYLLALSTEDPDEDGGARSYKLTLGAAQFSDRFWGFGSGDFERRCDVRGRPRADVNEGAFSVVVTVEGAFAPAHIAWLADKLAWTVPVAVTREQGDLLDRITRRVDNLHAE